MIYKIYKPFFNDAKLNQGNIYGERWDGGQQ